MRTLKTSDNDDNEYQVTVEATDGTNPVTLDVTVNVTNVEEAGTVTLSSVQPQVSTVLTATLSDPDVVSGNPTWQWAKADSAEGSFTTISTATTSSYTPVADDVDKYLQVTASYTDGEGSGKSAQSDPTLMVRVAPANNAAPEFAGETDARSIAENTAEGQNIGDRVAATDSDGDDTLTYSLSGTGAASFGINQVTGQLLTKSALDHETTPSYTVTVTAADPSNATDTITVTITVTDVNEAPEFPTETGARSVAENTAVGQPIGDAVSATDPDTNDTLTYSLSGTDAGSFAIDEQTGRVSVGDGTALNYEGNKKSYTVTVSVRDSKDEQRQCRRGHRRHHRRDHHRYQRERTAGVPDRDRCPQRGGEHGSRPANIGSPVAATDPDTNDTLTYSLSGTDAASFDINDQTGQISVGTGTALDYETRKSYTVTVSVRDSKNASGNADTATDDTIDVTITVTNEDDRITTNSNNNDKGDSDDLPGVLDPRQSVISVSPPANRAPVFTEGVSTDAVGGGTHRPGYLHRRAGDRYRCRRRPVDLLPRQCG